jgi:hypothetical protein
MALDADGLTVRRAECGRCDAVAGFRPSARTHVCKGGASLKLDVVWQVLAALGLVVASLGLTSLPSALRAL